MLRRIIAALLIILFAGPLFASGSPVNRSQVTGTGPLPYNYRQIDTNFYAGGHPINPANSFGNTDEQVLSILSYLKSKGVSTIIDLENTGSIQARYQRLLDQAGMTRIHIPLSSLKVPNAAEWATIKTALAGPVYVHCKWGADRTGMVIARYLVEEKGFTPDEAYAAVITGGRYAGPLGGFKKYIFNLELKNFIYDGVQ